MAIRRRALEHVDCSIGRRPWHPPAMGAIKDFTHPRPWLPYCLRASGARAAQHRRNWNALCRTFYGYGVGLFAWWTRTLLVEKELTLLKAALAGFGSITYVTSGALTTPTTSLPLDLALAEFRGACAGPGAYLRARRWRQRGSSSPVDEAYHGNEPTSPCGNRPSACISSRALPAMAGSQNLEVL